jgi:hypothetical protein
MLRPIACCVAAGVRFAVLEWAETGAAMVTVELDPAKLRPAAAPGTYDYSEALKDPR